MTIFSFGAMADDRRALHNDFEIDYYLTNNESSFLTKPVEPDIFNDEVSVPGHDISSPSNFSENFTTNGFVSNHHIELSMQEKTFNITNVQIPYSSSLSLPNGKHMELRPDFSGYIPRHAIARMPENPNNILLCNYNLNPSSYTHSHGGHISTSSDYAAPFAIKTQSLQQWDNPFKTQDDLSNEKMRPPRKVPYNGSFVRRSIPDSHVKDVDVLFGRGKKANNHPGNILFRELVMRMSPEYKDCKRKQKTAIANNIVGKIHKEGGRFLTLLGDNSDTYSWVETTGVALRKKTSQALRDSITYQR